MKKDTFLSGEFIKGQLRHNFSGSYLTLISIIQGVALGLWASNFSDMLKDFTALNYPLSAFVYPFLSVSSFVVVFFSYSWFVSVVVTGPDLRETLIPFSLGVFEILPTSFFSSPKTYWLLFAIFSALGAIAYYNTKINANKEHYSEDMQGLCAALHNQMKTNIALCTIASVNSFVAFYTYPNQVKGAYSIIHDLIFSFLVFFCIGALLYSNQKQLLREKVYKILELRPPIMIKCLCQDVKGLFGVISSVEENRPAVGCVPNEETAEQFKIANLIYSDVEFISLKYEEIAGKSPSSQLTKTKGMKAGLSIPLLSAGVHTQETRNYQLSSFGMLKEIYAALKEYPSFDNNINTTIIKPQIVWVQGHITVSIWDSTKEKSEKYTYFQMLADKDKSDFSLVTKAEYANSGYDSLFEISPAIQNNINIPVSALVKILYYSTAGKSFVSVPFLIIERET